MQGLSIALKGIVVPMIFRAIFTSFFARVYKLMRARWHDTGLDHFFAR